MATGALDIVLSEWDDVVEAIERCYELGWTDGLPVVPPTAERVDQFLDRAGRPAGEVLGSIPERRREVTVGKVAANAVMAGCLPEYMPVVLAATEAMLDVAITRAAKLGLENISFQVTPMEAIAYPDNRFDAVTCRFGLMHSDDAAAGLSQARRVLKPGGRAAFVVHGPAAPNNQWWLVHGAANEFFGSPSDARPARRNRYSGEGETGVLLQAAGFTDIEEKLFTTETRHRIVPDGGGPAIWRPMLERDFAQPLADLDAAAAAELEQRLAAAFAEFQDGDQYVLSASQRITTGVK